MSVPPSVRPWLVLTLVGGAVGAIYSDFVNDTPQLGGVVGLGIAGSIVGLELFYVQRRVGMHGGVVVASEIGDAKREIVYFGDTVNTAARLGALGKKVDRDFLISSSLLRELPVPRWVRVEPLGHFALEGKADALEVCALELGWALLVHPGEASPRAP